MNETPTTIRELSKPALNAIVEIRGAIRMKTISVASNTAKRFRAANAINDARPMRLVGTRSTSPASRITDPYSSGGRNRNTVLGSGVSQPVLTPADRRAPPTQQLQVFRQ